MNRQENLGVPYYTAPNLSELSCLRHGFSTRAGGVSSGPCATLNFGYLCEENQENVRQNYFIFCRALGLNAEHLVLTHQTHTTNIRTVTTADRGKGLLKVRDYTDIDGLVTDLPDTPLVIVSADCVPILFADPVRRVIGGVHAGWQGTLHEIATKMVERMVNAFGCDPANIRAAMGPSIGPCCYEVGQEVFQRFQAHPLLQKSDCLIQTLDGRYFIDLGESNRIFLLAAGLNNAHIHNAALCTKCHNDIFFSHRGQQGKKGLLAAMISLI